MTDNGSAPPADRPAADAFTRAADRVEELPDRLLLYADDGDAALAEVTRAAHRPLSALVRRATLEDVFLKMARDQRPDALQGDE